MKIMENGVKDTSLRYVFNPSSFARQSYYYPTRVGHYICDRRYHVKDDDPLAMEPGHRFHFLVFIVKKGAMIFHLKGKEYLAAKGYAGIVNCQDPHSYYSVASDLDFYWVLMNGIAMDTIYQQIVYLHSGNEVFHVTDGASMELLINLLIHYGLHNDHISEVNISEMLYSLICSLFKMPTAGESNIAKIVDEAMSYIDSHFRDTPSVKEIASSIGFSTAYFSQCFKSQTGFSPHEYLVLKQIKEAKELLLSSTMTIREIAFSIGYKSEANFIRSFKKNVGMTPSTYRNVRF